MIAVEGQPFHDADADAALMRGLHETLGDSVEVHELDTDINDPAFAVAMADRLHELVMSRRLDGGSQRAEVPAWPALERE
jgi:uncharacterized protein (UPF0261 family)